MCSVCEAIPAIEALTDGRIPEALTAREREITRLVSQGWRNKEIAGALDISEQTVKNNLRQVFDKVGVSDRVSLALYSIRKGGQL